MRGISNVEDLATWRDEVNEPLGLLPGPDPRQGPRIVWRIIPVAAPALVAVAMAAFTLGRRDEPPRAEPLALSAEAPRAPARVEPALSPGSGGASNPTLPPAAAADQIERASGVKVTRQGGGANAPTPLIIDVQQALAAARRTASGVQR
jgi:hypothetical protein